VDGPSDETEFQGIGGMMFEIDFNGQIVQFSFQHFRNVNFEIKPNRTVTDVTYCRLMVDNKLHIGLASCVAGDIFRKETGRKNALARAMKEAKLSKDCRTYIWGIYLNRDSVFVQKTYMMKRESAELSKGEF
jgi:hypothetical protein